MAQTLKTPGVYIEEKSAFPNSVVSAQTGVPAFLGYTEFARRDATALALRPTRITSMAEFEQLFGGRPHALYEASKEGAALVPKAQQNQRFLLHASLRWFFEQGGGPCWIVSVGGYGTAVAPTAKTKASFLAGLKALEKEEEPSLIVAPDAVLLSRQDWAEVSKAALAQCGTLRDRMALLDVYQGDRPRSLDPVEDVISGSQGFRALIGTEHLSFGAAYYPWMNTTVTALSDLNYSHVTAQSRKVVHKAVLADLTGGGMDAADAARLSAPLLEAAPAPKLLHRTHTALLEASPQYKALMEQMCKGDNVLPPSAAMAGVFAQVDEAVGVWNAPANIELAGVTSPTVALSDRDQADLNTPLDGKAVNAMRSFASRGILVWGARTLDGNSSEWRYINVRRTMNMIEQSARAAMALHVFDANDSRTWSAVAEMLENFLTELWKMGAVLGSTPQEAFAVEIGLGSTMTAQDILEGRMRVMLKLSLVHPAEFVVATLEQEMVPS